MTNSANHNSNIGKNIIYNKNRDMKFHLFVRKNKDIDDKLE